MQEYAIWWILAGAAVAVELMTGTFYLLMLALGMSAGALAAHMGAPVWGQFLAAALVGGGAVVSWRAIRGPSRRGPPAESNPDVNLDVGEVVQVEAWSVDRAAQVKYRGAMWSVSLAPEQEAGPGPHRVRAVVGSRLVLEKLEGGGVSPGQL